MNASLAVASGIDTQILIPSKDFKAIWKKYVFDEFKEWCKSSFIGKGRFYGDNFYNESKTPWFKNLNLDRKSIVMLNRLRAGHNSLKSHLYRINIIDDNKCRCGAVETMDHILCQCKLYDRYRVNLKTLLEKKSVVELLNSKDFNIINCIANFLKKIDINI